jgi:hypothetical protein
MHGPANVPEDEFTAAIESDNPATVTQLAAAGTQTRERPVPPPGFAEATTAIGMIRRFALFCAAHDADTVATGVLPTDFW